MSSIGAVSSGDAALNRQIAQINDLLVQAVQGQTEMAMKMTRLAVEEKVGAQQQAAIESVAGRLDTYA